MKGTTRNISDNLLLTGSYGESSSRSFPKNDRKIGLRAGKQTNFRQRFVTKSEFSLCYDCVTKRRWNLQRLQLHRFGDGYFFSFSLALLSLLSTECHENTGEQPGLIWPENSPTFAKEWNQRGRNQGPHKPAMLVSRNWWGKKKWLKRGPHFFAPETPYMVRKQVPWLLNSLGNRFLLIGSGGSGGWEIKSVY